MRKAKEVKDREEAKVEEERKTRKELRTGGGFNMEKYRKMKAEKEAASKLEESKER